MPTQIRLTAAQAGPARPLSAFLAQAAVGAVEMPEVVVVPVQDLESAGLDPYLGGPAVELAASLGVTGQAGDLGQVPIRVAGTGQPGSAGRLLLVGLGDESPAALRRAGAAVARRAQSAESVLVSGIGDRPAGAVRAFAEGMLLGSYRFSAAPGRSAARVSPAAATSAGPVPIRLLAADPGSCQATLDRAALVADATALARDLANTPSASKTPAWLAEQAAAVAAASGLTARVWDEAMLAEGGFGGLLGVGGGSAQPPRLIELGYSPPGWSEHIVLVGKGITFDSGGLSLKPPEGMQTMKTDMAGGAVVIAVMGALAALGARAKVTGLVAAAENMPSGSAMRPGDVLTHFGGRTVEVLNTDAEGRLVLADALAYAEAAHQPDVMVDVATLTGAARVALGTRIAALYSSDERLAGGLLEAASASGDPVWRMPLVEDYRGGLDSPVADLGNVARGAGARAGSIDAALFLREFVNGRPWAHLDIAGAARAAADDGEISKGATGFGARLLLEWLSR